MKTLFTLPVLSLTALLASCSTSATIAPKSAVTCTKCHTIHFMSPSTTGPGPKGLITLKHADSMSCPDCENQVIAMLKTGSLTKHVCKTCGGTLHHCAEH